MQRITSKENEKIKHIKKLNNKKYRDQNNEFVIEGIKMLSEAIQEKAKIKQIFICEDCEKSEAISKELMYEIAKFECIYIPQNIFSYISDVATPQGIIAIIEKNNESNIDYEENIIIALDDIQDPGNLGTIIRTIDSAGLKQIIISKGTVDVYNPKVVRSTMGAIFRVKIIESKDLEKTLKELKKHKYKTMVTSLNTTNTIYKTEYNKKVIIIGNEANGVKKEIQKNADELVKIPMLGKTESLNASVATSIIVYEYVRQKLNNSV